MSRVQRRVAVRIGANSVVRAGIFGAVAWYTEIEHAEHGIVSLAIEESEKPLAHFNSVRLDSPGTPARAETAADAIVSGLFGIAELYDVQGVKLAEAMTDEGAGLDAFRRFGDGSSSQKDRAGHMASTSLTNDYWRRVHRPY